MEGTPGIRLLQYSKGGKRRRRRRRAFGGLCISIAPHGSRQGVLVTSDTSEIAAVCGWRVGWKSRRRRWGRFPPSGMYQGCGSREERQYGCQLLSRDKVLTIETNLYTST